jgi:tetratricopeptide (TPR) repeat protein
LREHASEWEKLEIANRYYWSVTGELDKAAQTIQEEIASYPRSCGAHSDLANVNAMQGQYEKAAENVRQCLQGIQDPVFAYGNLANYTLALQHFDEARQFVHEAQARKLDNVVIDNAVYALAFLRSDTGAMAEQQQRFTGKPEENVGLALASDSEAFGGHLVKARDLTKRAVDSAIRADSKETGAIWQAIAAQRDAAYGNATEGRRLAAEALKLAPTSQGVGVEAAIAFAMGADAARAESLAHDLEKRYPLDTQMQLLWLPAIRAQLALDNKNPASALITLQAASPIELGQIQSTTYTYAETPIWPRDRPKNRLPSFRRFSITAASCGTAGRELWRNWAWLGRMRCSRERSWDRGRVRTPMPPASVRSPPTKISSRSGKTPTATSSSTNKPKPSTLSSRDSAINAPTPFAARKS